MRIVDSEVRCRKCARKFDEHGLHQCRIAGGDTWLNQMMVPVGVVAIVNEQVEVHPDCWYPSCGLGEQETLGEFEGL